MSDIVPPVSSVPVPAPRVELSFRLATHGDLAALDSLQKKYGKALGYFPTEQFVEYIEKGGVLVAEDCAALIGYCISQDRYLSRDELGVIFQLCVTPGEQRKFVGAALVREVFERSAYGCRLYCCWCAQDLEANRFWESLGFVPLAFRAGSDKKKRVHIFWQKKICEGDVETKWWYPFKIGRGALREDRLVFPIPPGTHWSEVKAVEVPEALASRPALPDKTKTSGRLPVSRAAKPALMPLGGFRFQSEVDAAPRARKAKAPKAPAAPIDPKYLKAARELRDRYLEHVNANGGLLAQGKYDVARALPDQMTPAVALLPAA